MQLGKNKSDGCIHSYKVHTVRTSAINKCVCVLVKADLQIIELKWCLVPQ